MSVEERYTPLELSQLLGERSCQNPPSFLVQAKEDVEPRSFSLEQFENFFHIIYRPCLTFRSYEVLSEVVDQCPYLLRSPRIAEENHHWGSLYRERFFTGATAPVSIKWIDAVFGYGLFAAADIAKGDFLGEYVGIVRPLSRRHPDHNDYCFHYPTRFWSWRYFTVDSLAEGNFMRFANHSDQPNMEPICAVDRGLLHIVFVAGKAIPQGTQLTFDYGEDYWVRRSKKTL